MPGGCAPEPHRRAARWRSHARPAPPAPRTAATAAPARWGWHRLDPATARHVVDRAGIRDGDFVVDLGAGSGVLTSALVEAGARVLAIELHPGRADILRATFAAAPVTVVRADVTTVRLPRRPFRVVANPPWSCAEAIRASLLRSPALVRADLVLPRWLVRRWAARYPRVSIGGSVRAESFTPAAPTGAAVAVLSGAR
jgi:23S rRNA (adenine-N6)-dimethyltransferase